MNRSEHPLRKRSLVKLLAVPLALLVGCNGSTTVAARPLTTQDDDFTGTISFEVDALTPFELEGTSPDFGDYVATGEVTFREGDVAGSLIGEGVAVFETPDGSELVAVVNWPVEPGDDDERASNIEFRWRDSVAFGDGTVAESTGRFADPDQRPPGLVVIAIIAVLIGLLLPAVQK